MDRFSLYIFTHMIEPILQARKLDVYFETEEKVMSKSSVVSIASYRSLRYCSSCVVLCISLAYA